MADADDGLSMELDAMYPASQPVAPPTGWHGRRLLTFGASEVPALLIALGMEQADDATPGYVLELAERLIDIKAGLRKPRKAGAAADRGSGGRGVECPRPRRLAGHRARIVGAARVAAAD
jgi:hypothetical protein